MSSPFDDAGKKFIVLINNEGQYSLWPSFAAVPAGWTIVLQASDRQACLEYVKEHWTDMRPKSLIEATKTQ
jgi:MbtH protein